MKQIKNTGKNIDRKSRLQLYIAHKGLMLLFLPGFLYFLVFHYIPMGGIVIAFKDYFLLKGIMASPWVGMKHFVRLFTSEGFISVIFNTVRISLLHLAFGFPMSIILALSLNEVKSGIFKRGIQTITYLPYFFSWVILGGIIRMLLSMGGPVNDLLTSIGIERTPFLSNGRWYLFTLVITGIWKGVGYGAVIYLAALSGIDVELYEAAIMDGAGRWKQTMYITLPCLIPTIMVMLILNLGNILNAGFDQIYNTTSIMVLSVSEIIDTYVLKRMQGLDYGLGTASGLFKSAVGFVMVLSSNLIIKRLSDGEAGIW